MIAPEFQHLVNASQNFAGPMHARTADGTLVDIIAAIAAAVPGAVIAPGAPSLSERLDAVERQQLITSLHTATQGLRLDAHITGG